jgi:inner membrane protein
VVLVRIVTRKNEKWAGAIFAAWIAVLSHILLDLTNDYGVRVWAPFSNSWFHWDTTYVIDPWIWAGLLVAFCAPMLGDLISSEIGKHRRAYPGRAWAITGLLFLLGWDAGRAVLHQRAIAVMDARLYGGTPPVVTAAFATPLRPWKWDGLVETGDTAYLYELNLEDQFDPGAGKTFHRGDPGDALGALRTSHPFRVLIDFSQYPLWRVLADANNSRYMLTDLRFGDPVARTFTCSARLTEQHAVADERCNFSFSSNYSPQPR